MASKVFQNGATWLRADFHLHTKTDRSFSYSGDENYYFSSYLDALARADIRVGVITNHNKFDFEEFKALRRKEILLLPGIELSVNNGFNGVHILIGAEFARHSFGQRSSTLQKESYNIWNL